MRTADVRNDEKAAIADQIHFGEFTIDLVRRGLYKGEERVRLTPKPFETLVCLAKRAGKTVEKHELLSEVWKETHVTEGTLAHAIKEIRRALGDDKDSPRFILTVHRQGYRFVCEISSSKTPRVSRRAQEIEPSSASKILRNRRRIDWKWLALGALTIALILTLALLYWESAIIEPVFTRENVSKSES